MTPAVTGLVREEAIEKASIGAYSAATSVAARFGLLPRVLDLPSEGLDLPREFVDDSGGEVTGIVEGFARPASELLLNRGPAFAILVTSLQEAPGAQLTSIPVPDSPLYMVFGDSARCGLGWPGVCWTPEGSAEGGTPAAQVSSNVV
jgi:hypothetical protein